MAIINPFKAIYVKKKFSDGTFAIWKYRGNVCIAVLDSRGYHWLPKDENKLSYRYAEEKQIDLRLEILQS